MSATGKFTYPISFGVLGMLGALFIRYFIVGTCVVTYKDNLVSCGSIRTPFDTLAVHASAEDFIRVSGKTYKRVRGFQPFYLRLPLLCFILFVTDSPSEVVESHIVPDGGGSDITIASEPVSFGNHIGSSHPTRTSYTEFVEKESTNEIILVSQYPHAKTHLFLDLQAKKLTKIEYDEFNEAGSNILHHVYVDGKRVN